MIANTVAKMAEYNMKNSANFVKYTAAGINAFDFAYKAGAFALNKNIPEEQRKFMVAQEISEGVVSTGILLTLASGFKKLGEKLVDKAKILPSELPEKFINAESIKQILANNSTYANAINNCKSSVGLASTIICTVVAFNILTPIIRNKIASFFQKKMNQNKPAENNKTAENNAQKAENSGKSEQISTINEFKDYLTKKNNT